jgi:hypothetical protein
VFAASCGNGDEGSSGETEKPVDPVVISSIELTEK